MLCHNFFCRAPDGPQVEEEFAFVMAPKKLLVKTSSRSRYEFWAKNQAFSMAFIPIQHFKNPGHISQLADG